MTSAETASGKYPVETVEAMAAICLEAERAHVCKLDTDFVNIVFNRIDQSIAYGALFTAYHLRVKAIVALTESGSTALWMSRQDIDIPIFAITPNVSTCRKAALYRNVTAFEVPFPSDRDAALKAAQELLIRQGKVQRGDLIVLTSGQSIGQIGGTNSLQIMRVGE
jgi:pyruvate kinase